MDRRAPDHLGGDDMKLKVRDAAELLGVSSKTIYRWIADRKIPFHRFGDQYRFERSELFDFAIQERLRPAPALLEEDPDPQELVTAAECLATGGIFYRIEGRTKHEALAGALAMLRGMEGAAMAPLLEMFLAREELASTGIGDGIAIPHTRTPLVGYISRPLLALAFLEHPVPYGALDGKPVHALFLLVSPTVRAHLRILGRLAFALRHPDFRTAVIRQATREVLLTTLRRVEAEFTE